MGEKITKETCLSCGACCVAFSATKMFADVTLEDEKRLTKKFGKKFVRLNVLHFSPFDMLMHMASGEGPLNGALKTRWMPQKAGPHKDHDLCSCTMLRGSVMHKTRCGIYKDRPEVCHTAVVPGDRACRTIRTAFKTVT